MAQSNRSIYFSVAILKEELPTNLKFDSYFSTKNLRHVLDVAEDIEFVGKLIAICSIEFKICTVTGSTFITSINNDINADILLTLVVEVKKATILDGLFLHGNKLSIKEIVQKDLLQIKGSFDEEFLQSGIITAWKISDTSLYCT